MRRELFKLSEYNASHERNPEQESDGKSETVKQSWNSIKWDVSNNIRHKEEKKKDEEEGFGLISPNRGREGFSKS